MCTKIIAAGTQPSSIWVAVHSQKIHGTKTATKLKQGKILLQLLYYFYNLNYTFLIGKVLIAGQMFNNIR